MNGQIPGSVSNITYAKDDGYAMPRLRFRGQFGEVRPGGPPGADAGQRVLSCAAPVHPVRDMRYLEAEVTLEYDNGVNGAYWCSQIAAGHYNGLVVRVFGDQGALEWRQEQPDYLYYTPKGEAMQVLTRGGNGIDQPAGGYSRLPVGHPEGLYVAFANIYRDYVTALIEKKAGRPYDTGSITMVDAGVDGVKFVHAVVESAEKDSAWVEL